MKKVYHIAANFADAEKWNVRQHAEMPVAERLKAVEFLREQCGIVMGLKQLPRIRKAGRVGDVAKSP